MTGAEDELASVAQNFDLTRDDERQDFVLEMQFCWADERMATLRRIADRLGAARQVRTRHDPLIDSIVRAWIRKQDARSLEVGDVVTVVGDNTATCSIPWTTTGTHTVVKEIVGGGILIERTITRDAIAQRSWLHKIKN